MTDGDVSFYTGLSSYATFMSIFEYLNPRDNCTNIRSRGGVTDVPEDFYNSDSDDERKCSSCKERTSPKAQAARRIFHCAFSSEKRVLRKTFGPSRNDRTLSMSQSIRCFRDEGGLLHLLRASISPLVRRSSCFVRRFAFLNLGFYMCLLRSLYLAQRRASRRFLALRCLQTQTYQSDESCVRWAFFSSQAAFAVQSGPFFFRRRSWPVKFWRNTVFLDINPSVDRLPYGLLWRSPCLPLDGLRVSTVFLSKAL